MNTDELIQFVLDHDTNFKQYHEMWSDNGSAPKFEVKVSRSQLSWYMFHASRGYANHVVIHNLNVSNVLVRVSNKTIPNILGVCGSKQVKYEDLDIVCVSVYPACFVNIPSYGFHIAYIDGKNKPIKASDFNLCVNPCVPISTINVSGQWSVCYTPNEEKCRPFIADPTWEVVEETHGNE
jgi:hypothetical protein